MERAEVTASIELLEELSELELEELVLEELELAELEPRDAKLTWSATSLVDDPGGEDVTNPVIAPLPRMTALPPIPRPPRLPTPLPSPLLPRAAEPIPLRAAEPLRFPRTRRREPISVPPQLEWTQLVATVAARRKGQRRRWMEAGAACLSLLGLAGAGAAFALTLRDWSPTPSVEPARAVIAATLPASMPAATPSAPEPIAQPEALPLEAPEQHQRAAEAGAAMLSLSSFPSSRVVLDGRPLGNTPLVVPVSPGPHRVLFVHPERGRVLQQVVAGAGRTKSVSTRFAE